MDVIDIYIYLSTCISIIYRQLPLTSCFRSFCHFALWHWFHWSQRPQHWSGKWASNIRDAGVMLDWCTHAHVQQGPKAESMIHRSWLCVVWMLSLLHSTWLPGSRKFDGKRRKSGFLPCWVSITAHVFPIFFLCCNKLWIAPTAFLGERLNAGWSQRAHLILTCTCCT